MNILTASQTNNTSLGQLQINVTSESTSFPIPEASISISYTGVPGPILEQLQTNSSGQTETIDLAAPPVEYSLNPNTEIQPYSEYTLNVTAPGYEPHDVKDTFAQRHGVCRDKAALLAAMLRAAGLDDIIADCQAQLDAYLAK